MKFQTILILAIVFLSGISCSDETLKSKPFGFVVTKPINVEVSGATLSGDILDLGMSPIKKHGFIITDHEYPDVKSFVLGSEEKAQTGEYTLAIKGGLQKDHTYEVQAFIESSNHVVIGNNESFTSLGSLPPKITSFSPQEGSVGTVVEIVGENLGYVRSGLVVKFGDTESVVDSVMKDRIRVIVPSVSAGGDMNITIETGGMTTTSSTTFNLSYPWIRKADFPGTYLWLVSSFELNGKIFVLGGLNIYPWQIQNEFWVYDPGVDSWSQLPAFPGEMRYDAIGFSCDGKGYFGLGRNAMEYMSDFWEYDPTNGSWTQLEDYPGKLADHVRAFNVQNKAYVATAYTIGTYGDSYETEVWEFNQLTKQWLRKKDFPYGRQYGFSLSGSQFGYLGMGTNGWRTDDIHAYEPSSDSWTLIGNYPGEGWNSVGSFFINDKIYAGMGSNNSTDSYSDFWEFDISNATWKKMQPCPTRLSPFLSVTIGNKGYLGYGWNTFTSSDTYMGRVFYEFDPAKN